MTKNLVIFGNGQMAEIVYEYITRQSDYTPIAFTCDQDYITLAQFKSLPVFPFESLEDYIAPDEAAIIIVMSPSNNNLTRREHYDSAKKRGYIFASFISPDAKVYPTCEIGDNCFILEDNTIQHFSSIGNNVVMWSGNHLGHHSVIGDDTFVTSHVVISGRCQVGIACFLGVNSTIRDGIKIGDRAVVGAGANILKDLPSNCVAMGLPSKIISHDSSTANLF